MGDYLLWSSVHVVSAVKKFKKEIPSKGERITSTEMIACTQRIPRMLLSPLSERKLSAQSILSMGERDHNRTIHTFKPSQISEIFIKYYCKSLTYLAYSWNAREIHINQWHNINTCLSMSSKLIEPPMKLPKILQQQHQHCWTIAIITPITISNWKFDNVLSL